MRREDGLVGFKRDAIVEFIVFVEVYPGSVGAGLPVIAIRYDPLVVLNAADVALGLRQELVIDANVTVRCSPHEDLLAFVLEIENLSAGRAPEDLQFKACTPLSFLVASHAHTHLARFVSVEKVHDDVCLSHVHYHVVLEHCRSVKSRKNAMPDTEVLDEVLQAVRVEADLEMATPLLFCRLWVLGRNDEIVHDSLCCGALNLDRVICQLLDALLTTEVDVAVLCASFSQRLVRELQSHRP